MDGTGEAPPPITRIKVVSVFENKYGTLYNDETAGPRGDPGRYLRWDWKGRGVVVIPEHRGRVGTWTMFRYPIGKTSLEFPRGGAEPGEPLESAAVRELKEETGLYGHSPRSLGHLQAESGLIASPVEVIVVKVDDPVGTGAQAEPMESVAAAVEWLDPAAFTRKISRGILTCGVTMAAWAMWRADTESTQ